MRWMPHIRLTPLGDLVIEDESLSIMCAGLWDGATVTIEQGMKPAPETLLLRVARLTGNDHSVKVVMKQSCRKVLSFSIISRPTLV
jgi:hypothetical protein